MKKQFILAAMAVAALFTACSNEEENMMVPAEGAEVNFVIGGPVTRTTTNATTGVTSFQEGDAIAIYSSGLLNDMAGAKFIVGNGGSLNAEGSATYNFNGTNGASFYAYYPATATGSATSTTFTVAEDQSAANAFGINDFMTASQSVNAATDAAIALSFKHRLTLVKVEVTGITATSVKINRVHPTVTWTYGTNEVATTTGDETKSIQMGKNGNEYWAVIPAQTITKDNALITITATNGNEYTYTPTANDVVFNENKAKRFKLTLSADGATLVSLSTELEAQWGTEQGDETGNLTENPLIPAVTASTQVNTLTSNRTQLATGTWGTLFTAADFAATATPQDGGFDIEVSSQVPSGGSWYNRTLYYKGIKDFDITKTYTLKFKASSLVSGQLWINVTARDEEKGKDEFYYLTTTDTQGARVLANTTTAGKEFTITITPRLTTESSTANNDLGFTETTYTDYYIGICASSSALTTYSIRDITLTQN